MVRYQCELTFRRGVPAFSCQCDAENEQQARHKAIRTARQNGWIETIRKVNVYEVNPQMPTSAS